MEELAYYVADHNVPIARWMNLETTLTLLQALCSKYWKDPGVHYTVAREPYERAVEYCGEEKL